MSIKRYDIYGNEFEMIEAESGDYVATDDYLKEKQAIKQRLIDAFHEHYARKMQVPMIYKEVIELIEKEFSDK